MLEAPLEKVHKIKLLKEEKIQLVYTLVSGQECDIKYRDQARPEFHDAMAELLHPCLDLLELPKLYAARMSTRGLSFSWKDGIMGAVITLQKELQGADSPLILNTPHLPEMPYGEGENKLLPDQLLRALRECLVEAELYLKGERAQMALAFKAEAAADNREEELQLN